MNLGETGQHIDHHFFSFESDPSPEIKKNTLLYCQGLGLYFLGQTRIQNVGATVGEKFILPLDYIRNNAENNKQWQDLQLLQDKNVGYSYGNNPLDDSGLGGIMPNAMDESVQTVSTISFLKMDN